MKDPVRPWVLGIGASHNGATCLLRGEDIVVAVQEERLLRSKRAEQYAGLPSLSIRYCLDAAGIRASDLSAVGVCALNGSSSLNDAHLNPQLRTAFNEVPVSYVSHHLGHATAAFATSGFDASAVLVIDGNGSPLSLLEETGRGVIQSEQLAGLTGDDTACEVLSTYVATGARLTPHSKHVGSRRIATSRSHGMRPFFSLGRLFENVGWQVFGEPLDGPGKVMGLAAYGRRTIPTESFWNFTSGQFAFPEDVPSQFSHDDRWPSRRVEYSNLAASVQGAIEDAILTIARQLKSEQDCPRLCYAGGVALNSIANERLIAESGFSEVFIMPAAEDSGTAIGAAYHALWRLRERGSTRRMTRDSVGCSYRESDVVAAAKSFPFLTVDTPPDLMECTSRLLTGGSIVGWFQEGSELGPRALGQRSILADPRRAETKRVLDEEIKFREPFRPYAAAILREHLADWCHSTASNLDSPFMLRIMTIHKARRAEVPAIVHADGTVRVQTVNASDHPRLHALLTTFYRETGIPLILNTSLNGSGEPIVETPEDALLALTFSRLDACVVEGQLFQRTPALRTPLSLRPVVIYDWVSSVTVNGHGSPTTAAPFFYSHAATGPHAGGAIPGIDTTAHVRVGVSTRWGSVIHTTSLDVLTLLRLINGRHSGEALLAAMSRRGYDYTPLAFQRLLSRLASARMIAFKSPRSERTRGNRL